MPGQSIPKRRGVKWQASELSGTLDAVVNLVTRLERVIRRRVLERLPEDPSGEVEALPLARLLIVYGNWRGRVPAPVPRSTHVSAVLTTSPKGREHAEALRAITSKIEAGTDLTAHLSRGITVAHEPSTSAKPHQRRRDLDLLLADWGIHYLHLSTAIAADGFFERTPDLLFAAFSDGDAYLIDVLPHGSWTELTLLETLVREWPDAGLLMSSLTGLRLKNGPTPEERRELRNAGAAQLVEIDGVLYMPPMQTTAGTPMRVTRCVNALMWALDEWRGDAEQRLRAHRPSEADVYWVPAVEGEECGFTDGELFVRVGRLA